MIDPKKFIEYLTEKEIDFYCGVHLLLKELSFSWTKELILKIIKLPQTKG